jgi:hypothetical protein
MNMAMRSRCEETVLRFMAHFDRGEFQQMEKYIASEGVWKRADGEYRGVEGIRQLARLRAGNIKVRHVITNLLLTVLAEGKVRMDSYVCVFRAGHQEGRPSTPATTPFAIGRYEDRLVLEDGSWKILEKSVTIDFH